MFFFLTVNKSHEKTKTHNVPDGLSISPDFDSLSVVSALRSLVKKSLKLVHNIYCQV